MERANRVGTGKLKIAICAGSAAELPRCRFSASTPLHRSRARLPTATQARPSCTTADHGARPGFLGLGSGKSANNFKVHGKRRNRAAARKID
jgi:hypothetical protein